MELLSPETRGDAPVPYARSSEPSPLGVATTNADGEILAVNDAFVNLLRSRARDLIGKRLRIPAPQQRTEERFLTADGEEVWLSAIATPTCGPDGEVEQIVWIFEACNFEEQRRQADRLASLERMAATIAHEFNNVLMGISPFVEVIRRGKSIDTSLDHISRAVKRGKRLTEEILRFTRSPQPQPAQFEIAPPS